jgi:hypothetical protein
LGRVSALNLKRYIAKNKLNELRKTHPNPRDVEWDQHNRPLRVRTRNLVDALEMQEAGASIAALGSPFEAAKIILSFTNRLRGLSRFAHDGLIRFPLP